MAMRQLILRSGFRDKVTTTNVDLIEHNIDDLPPIDKQYLEVVKAKYPGIINAAIAPRFIKSNAETVSLPQPADVITSVEVTQYLNNPLMALCNWYNNLACNKIMIVSADDYWSNWIRYENSHYSSDPSPLEPFIALLRREQILFAVSDDSYYPGMEKPDPLFLARKGFCNMVIQKKPGTSLVLRAEVKKIWRNPHDYKEVYYEQGGPVVELGDAKPTSIDPGYFEQMENVFQKRSEY